VKVAIKENKNIPEFHKVPGIGHKSTMGKLSMGNL